MVNFTDREKEVLYLLLKGLNNREISEKLCITNHTTKIHITSIYKKLEVTNRIQAVIKCLTNNFDKLLDDSKFQS